MWLSQIARAASNTTYSAVARQTARAVTNQTAIIEGGTIVQPGETAVVNPNNVLLGYVPNNPTQVLTDGSRYVPPTTKVGATPGNPGVDIANPEQFVEFNEFSVYSQQTPTDGGNEYVFTNGIDFGLEIRF